MFEKAGYAEAAMVVFVGKDADGYGGERGGEAK